MPFVGFAAGLAAPELGPPGGSRFGPAFIFGDCPSQVFGIAMSGAAPFWGPPGGPRNGSVRTKYVYGWGRQAAPVLSSFFGPRIFQAFFLHRRVRGGAILGSIWWTPNRVRGHKLHCGGFAICSHMGCFKPLKGGGGAPPWGFSSHERSSGWLLQEVRCNEILFLHPNGAKKSLRPADVRLFFF